MLPMLTRRSRCAARWRWPAICAALSTKRTASTAPGKSSSTAKSLLRATQSTSQRDRDALWITEPDGLEAEMEGLHDEMARVFGDAPADTNHLDAGHGHLDASDVSKMQQLPVQPFTGFSIMSPRRKRRRKSVTGVSDAAKTPPVVSPRVATGPTVQLLQGPCTYAHGWWVGCDSTMSQEQVKEIAERAAAGLQHSLVHQHSNHEGEILDALLTAPISSKIILNWNGVLADSPALYQALSIVHVPIVLLTPRDVHQPSLPAAVRGVIAGLGAYALELAVLATIRL